MAKFTFTPATELEAQNVKVEGNGISGEPVFYKDGGTDAVVGTLAIKDASGKVVHSYRVVVSGKSLTAFLEERTGPVPAKFEASKAAPSLTGK